MYIWTVKLIKENLMNKPWLSILFICTGLWFVSLSSILAIIHQPSSHIDKYAHFIHFTTQDGLSNNLVLNIIQDKFGQMWFATLDGLTRFDGIHYTIYKNNEDQPSSLSDNRVTSLAEDFEGNLWIGTYKGLNKYDRQNDCFIQYLVDKKKKNDLQDNHVKTLYADDDGLLWIECNGGFLSCLNVKTLVWEHVTHTSLKIEGKYYYHHIFEDSQHTLWVGGRLTSIARLPAKNIHAIQFPILNQDEVYFDPGCFVETTDSILLCSDYEGNIGQYNPLTGYFNTILRIPLAPTCALRDNDGKIWIGGDNGGVIRLDLSKNHFDLFKNDAHEKNSLLSNNINCLYKDLNGNIWIGTDKGVSLYSILRNQIRSYPRQNVTALMQDRDGLIWVGTENDGVDTFNIDREEFGNLTYNLLTQQLSKETFDREKQTLKQYFLHETITSTSSNPEKAMVSYQNYRSAHLRFTPFNENKVSALYEDKMGKIYIGLWSHVGFNIFDKSTKTFKRHALWSKKPDYNYPYLLAGNPYGSNWYVGFLEDSQSRFWCATWEGVGLNLFDRDKEQFTGKHYLRQDYPQGYAYIQNIAFDKKRERLYMAGGRYYGYYDLGKRSFTRYGEILPKSYPNKEILNNYYTHHNAELINIPMYGREFNMYFDGNDHIWLSGQNFVIKHTLSNNLITPILRTETNWAFTMAPSTDKKYLYLSLNTELYRITLATDQIMKIKNNQETGTIKALYVDSLQNLWIGADHGLYLYKPDTHQIDSIALPSFGVLPKITAIESISQNMYIGCSTGIIIVKNGKQKDFLPFRGSSGSGLPGTSIQHINSSEKGILWISTNQGLVRFSLSDKQYKTFTHDEQDPYSIPHDYVYYTFGPLNGQIWVSTKEWISTFNLEKQEFTNLSIPDSTSLTSRLASCIIEDYDGNIWLGTTEKGLNKLNPKTEKIMHFIHQAWDTTSLSNNNVSCLFQDSRKRIWVGTEKGLCLYLPEKNCFTHIRFLAERAIRSILEDNNKYLWIATDNGLYCLDSDVRLFRIFKKYHGFPNNDYSSAAYKLKDGKLAIGGDYGFDIFDPASLTNSIAPPPILLTHFKVRDSIRYENVNILDKIELKHTDNSFSLEFSAADYVYGTHLSYRYRLEGFDTNDTYTQFPYLNAKYTNIPSGNYRFLVKATNSFGEWDGKIYSVLIHISTPWYRQSWFICLVITFIIGGIIFFIQYREKKLKRQKLKLEKIVFERTRALSDAIDSKNKFFSIISHDLKNPIHSIYTTANTLYKEYDHLEDNEKREIIHAIDKASQQTHALLENLLLWALSQRDIISPNKQKIKLSNFVNTIIATFQSDADKKNIQIINSIQLNNLVYTDGNMLAIVFRNLLSNAIKFSYLNEKVIITTSHSRYPNKIEIKIEDHGTGISKQRLEHLFEPNFKSHTKGTNHEEGNGIGLIIVHEFIIKMGERIFVTSKVGEGSIFCFTLNRHIEDEKN